MLIFTEAYGEEQMTQLPVGVETLSHSRPLTAAGNELLDAGFCILHSTFRILRRWEWFPAALGQDARPTGHAADALR